MSLELDFAATADLVVNQLSTVDGTRQDDYKTPGDLAKALDHMTVQTPMLDILDQALIDVDAAVDSMLRRRALYSKYRTAGMDENEARDCSEAEVPLVGKNRLLISLGPQEGKSERCSRYGVLWMLRRHPQLRVALVSYGDALAQSISYNIRSDIEINNGEEGNVDIGLRLQKDNRAKGSWRLDNQRGSVYAIGIGGSLTGRPVDLLLIDDPVKDFRAADSLLLSELAWQWWQSVARTRLAPGAPVIIILTRWHENDMAGRLLAKQREDEKSELKHYDKWHVINIPAQADHDPEKGETDILGRQPGEFMLSARGRTQSQWESIKGGMTPRIWTALYQGKPSPDAGDVFNRNWWMRYSTPIWSQDADETFHVHEANEVLLSFDATFKDNTSSDYVAGQVWARKGANCYLLDQVHARLNFTDSVAAVRRMAQRWPQATVKLIEDTANGPAIIASLRKEIGGIIPVQAKGSKLARAQAVAPYIESNNVFLPTSDIALYDVEGFIEECTQFPNGAHDDRVDAMSQALSRLYLKGGGAQAWFESLMPPCSHCDHPNAKSSITCSACGEALHDESADTPPEPFSLTSQLDAPLPPMSGHNEAVMRAIQEHGPSNSMNNGLAEFLMRRN